MNKFEHIYGDPCTARSHLNKFKLVGGGGLELRPCAGDGQGQGTLNREGVELGLCMVGTLHGQADGHN